MSGTISSVQDFTAAGVCERLGLSLSEKFERKAVDYVFNLLTRELSPSCGSRLEGQRIAAKATEHEISHHLLRVQRFKDDFFLGDKIKEKALLLAAICDSYVNHVNEPLQDEDGNMIPHNDGFDEDVVLEATAIWDEAQEISKTGWFETNPREESVFLAHIMAFDILEQIEQNMQEDPDFDDLEEILETDLKPILAFVRRATLIGNDLGEYADIVQRKIQDIISPPSPTPVRGGLRLVHDADKPQP